MDGPRGDAAQCDGVPVTGAELCTQAAIDLRARADAEGDPKAAEILRAVATSLDVGRADPVSAEEALRAAAAGRAAHATRSDVLHSAASYIRPSGDELLAVGRLRCERLEAFFGWRLMGYGYPSAGARFEAGCGEFDVAGPVMSALLAHVYAAGHR